MEWICNECGSRNDGGSTRCAICGAQRPRAVRAECPRCGHVQWAYSGTRCEKCGGVFAFAADRGAVNDGRRPAAVSPAQNQAQRPAGAASRPAANRGVRIEPALSMDEFAVERQAPSAATEAPQIKKPPLGRRILGVLPIAVVVALVIASAGLYIATKDTRGNENNTAAPAAFFTVGAEETESDSAVFPG